MFRFDPPLQTCCLLRNLKNKFGDLHGFYLILSFPIGFVSAEANFSAIFRPACFFILRSAMINSRFHVKTAVVRFEFTGLALFFIPCKFIRFHLSAIAMLNGIVMRHELQNSIHIRLR